jgi:hypothetical protein
MFESPGTAFGTLMATSVIGVVLATPIREESRHEWSNKHVNMGDAAIRNK